jgi:hypothetical protein
MYKLDFSDLHENDNVVIFEAAFRHENLFIRHVL